MPLAEPARKMDLSEISNAALKHPEVVSGFVQQTNSLDRHRISRVPGGGGAWNHHQAFTTKFRVWILTDKGYGESESEDLKEAVRSAFEQARIQPPSLQ